MALIKTGGGVAVISGSVGGTVFSRNKGGAYIRNRTIPINPNSPAQVVVKAAMAFLTSYWAQTLSAAERIAWNLYASNVSMVNRIGEAVFHSGFNHFVRSNMIRKQLGFPIISPGPVVFELPAQDPTFAITASEATQVITTVYDAGMDWADETDAWLVVFQGRPQNPQRNFFNGPWLLAAALQGVNGAPPASPLVVNASIAFAELQHLWCYARIMRADGRLSEPFRADTFCAA